MCQVLSASLEWSVISMLKQFTFAAILVSTYLTWHSTFLFKGKDDLSSRRQHRYLCCQTICAQFSNSTIFDCYTALQVAKVHQNIESRLFTKGEF